MKRILPLVVGLLCVTALVYAGVDKDKAKYAGGTVKAIPQETVGSLEDADENTLRFAWPGGSWILPYKQIRSIEFGQKIKKHPFCRQEA